MNRPKLTFKEIEGNLTDDYWLVRANCALSKEWGPPSPEQVERGLADKDLGVREAWLMRRDALGRLDYDLTTEQIRRLMRDSCVWVRLRQRLDDMGPACLARRIDDIAECVRESGNPDAKRWWVLRCHDYGSPSPSTGDGGWVRRAWHKHLEQVMEEPGGSYWEPGSNIAKEASYANVSRNGFCWS